MLQSVLGNTFQCSKNLKGFAHSSVDILNYFDELWSFAVGSDNRGGGHLECDTFVVPLRYPENGDKFFFRKDYHRRDSTVLYEGCLESIPFNGDFSFWKSQKSQGAKFGL